MTWKNSGHRERGRGREVLDFLKQIQEFFGRVEKLLWELLRSGTEYKNLKHEKSKWITDRDIVIELDIRFSFKTIHQWNCEEMQLI